MMLKSHHTLLVIPHPSEGEDCACWFPPETALDYRLLMGSYDTQTLEICRSFPIDSILLKFDEPSCSSLAFLRQLKETMGITCPPIIGIGTRDIAVAVQAFRYGITDYLIQEDMTIDELRFVMQSAIENTRLQRELQQSREQFQTSVENMLDCFGIFSAIRDQTNNIVDFRIEYLNTAACESNQMSKEMQIGRDLCEVLPGHRTSGLFDEYCQVVATGEPLMKEALVYEDTYNEQQLIRAFDIRASQFNDGFVASWRDVTDRKRLELELNQTVTQLQQKHDQLQRLIDTAPIGIGIGAANGEVKSINDVMLALHGYTRAEFEQQGMNWREFTPPEFCERTEQAMDQLQQQGFLPPEEKELLRRDGSRVPIWISVNQWMGATDEHVAFAIDLTQYKQAEATVKASQRHYQVLAEAMPQMVWTADATGVVNYWNQRWYAYSGLSETESMRLAGTRIIHPDDRDRTLEQWEECVRNGQPFEIEYRLCRWDGVFHWFISRGIPNSDDQGRVTGWIGTITDIDHQKRLEEQLRLVLNAVDGLIFDADLRTDRVYRSEKLFDLIGVQAEDASPSATWWHERIHPDDLAQLNEKLPELLSGSHHLYEGEYRVRHENGHWVDVWERGCLVRNAEGQVIRIVGSTVDITQRKRVEMDLHEAHIQLEAALAAGSIYTWRWNIPDDQVIADRNFAQLFGIEVDGARVALPIEHFLNAMHVNDRDRVTREIQQAIVSGESLTTEYRIHPANGEVRWVIARGQVEYDGNGTPINFPGALADISDRKQVEVLLQENEERFRTLADNISQLAWMADEQGWIFWYNQRWFNYTGTTLEEMQGWGWRQVHHPDHVDRVVHKFRQHIEVGEIWEDTFPIRGKDGQYRWFLSRAIPVRDEQNRILRWLGTNTDITDLRQAELALRENEQMLRLALTAARQGIWDWDLTHQTLTWDARCKEILGLPPDLPVTYEWHLATVHPDDRQRVQNAVTLALRERREFNEEYRTVYVDGTIRWILARGCGFYNATGEPYRMSGTVMDVTERKQAEALMAADLKNMQLLRDLSARLLSEDNIQVLYDQILAAAIALMQANAGSIQILDEATQELSLLATYGFDRTMTEFFDRIEASSITSCTMALATGRSTFINFDVPETDDPDGCLRMYLNAGYRSAQSIPLISRLGRPIGMVSVHWCSYHQPTDRELRFLDLLARQAADLIEQRQAAAERKRLLEREQLAREEAERANRAKDEFLAILSHELRSPLNPILGWARLLQTRNFDAARTAEALATIERNAKLQTQLIDDLLDIAKILRGKLSMMVAPVDLVSVVEAAIDTVKTAAIAKNILLHSVLPRIGLVAGDAARLQQVVWNLLSNAIKFTPRNGRVEIWLESVDHQVQVTVSDTGKGINPNFLPYIFDSFRQEDASTTRNYGGLGLGLAIVRHLVEAHGGTIWADSLGENQGTTFTMRLPLLEIEPQNPVEESCEPELDLTGIRVLVVDDEPDARQLMTVLLSQYGAEVLTVDSAVEVLANLENFWPHVLVSDLGMPQMDGYDLIRQIRALPAEQGGMIPAIALSAYAREEDYQRTLRNGYQRHLSKPLEPTLLMQAVMALAHSESMDCG